MAGRRAMARRAVARRKAPRRSPEAMRDALLTAAETCFGARGYHETTVDDIAEAAGVSKGAVYWHFDGKRELFVALLERYGAAVEGALEPAGAGRPAADALRDISEAVLGVTARSLPIIAVTLEYIAHAGRDQDLREALRRRFDAVASAARVEIERGMRAREFRRVDADTAAIAFVAAMDGVVGQKVLRPELDLERTWRETEAILIRGLQA